MEDISGALEIAFDNARSNIQLRTIEANIEGTVCRSRGNSLLPETGVIWNQSRRRGF
jgi:hypothetical protein